MNVLLYVSVCFVLTKSASGGTFSLPNPMSIAESVAGKIDNQTRTIAGGVAKEIKSAAESAQNASVAVTNGTKTIIGKVHNGVFDLEKGFVNGVDEVIGTPVDLKEVTFYLATSKNVENPTQIDYYRPENVAQTKGKIYFLIHGWMASKNSTWYQDLSKILIETDPETHVVEVDWAKPASENYAFAAFNTESVGNFVGILINKLVIEYKVPKENIILIGHSLGGQISGWAGKKFKELNGEKLQRIVALDPAGPLFIHRPDSRRLNKNDAEVVMVIHSDGGKLGYPFECGTIDFFPNGGSNQPGCWTVDLGRISTYVEPVTCDHSRAWDFFVEAVNSTGSFLAKKCKNYDDFRKKLCDAVEVAMGDLRTKAEGSFFLETNPERPYSKFFQKIVGGIHDGIDKIKEDIEKYRHDSSSKNHETSPNSTNVSS